MKRACEHQDLETVKTEFLKWLNQQSTKRKVFALSDARKLISDKKAAEILADLEKALYGGKTGPINFDSMITFITKSDGKQGDSIISPLYPD